MNFREVSGNIDISLVKAASAAATTTITTDVLAMSGFESAMFFTTVATKDVGNFLTGSQGTDSGGSDMATLAGSKVTAVADADIIALDIQEPKDPYLRCDITRGVSTAIGEVWAVRYNPRTMPTVWADVLVSLQSPEEGTP